ncbi:MAG: OmpA family protein [Alphaproteobacteria bacterium]|nr:OmpA family protein [Alphaproteobacteria bacterium]
MLALLGLLLLPSPAQAQDAVSLELVRHGQVGAAPPAVAVTANDALAKLDVRVVCGATRAEGSRAPKAGEVLRLELDVPQGRHSCKGTLSIRTPDGETGEMPLSFEVERLPPMKLAVARDDLDLAAGTVALTADRDTQAVVVQAFGEDGLLVEGRGGGTGAGGRQSVEFGPAGGEVVRLVVDATDVHGFQSRLELFPWHYAVPHEDVVFESGKAEVRPGEAPKLQDALKQIREVEARYGKWAPVNLYVAGFTDTVGDAGSNQALSEARARAIAGWFRAQGFTGTVWYQGFGERGLAVPTPDGTDEERNRRADYIVAAEAPPSSELLPGTAWKKL